MNCNELNRALFDNRMLVKLGFVNRIIDVMARDKWKIGAIAGGIWGLISFVAWIMASGGPTSSANPPIIFVILTLPASIPVLIAYYIIDIPGTLIVYSIPIFGAVIGALIGYAYGKMEKIKMKKLFCIFSLVGIICMSTVVSSAENTGTLTLDLILDTQVKAMENINQTTQFRPMYIKVFKITDENRSIYWEGNVTEPKDINIKVPFGKYEVHVREQGKRATWVYNNNEEGYTVTSQETIIVPLSANNLGLDIVADVPWRIEPNKNIPLLLMVKDADQNDYPVYEIRIYDDKWPYGGSFFGEDVLVDTIDLTGSGTCFGKTYLNIDHDWYYGEGADSIHELNPASFTKDSNGIIHIYVYYDAATLCDPFNYDAEFSINLKPSDYYLPSLSNWYAGDVHYHSNYTDNSVEFGFPIESTVDAGKAIGLDWVTVTDHSFDLDSHMPSLDETGKWAQIGNDCRDVSQGGYSDSEFKCIRGEEVSSVNADGKFIHFLSYGISAVIEGEGADGLPWPFPNEDNLDTNGDGWDDYPETHSLSEVITFVNNQGGFGYAAHPEAHPWHDVILERGKWQPEDYALEGYVGLEVWNTINNDNDRDSGLKIWEDLLLSDRKVFISGGSDAHGDFSHSTTVLGDSDNAFGKVRTYVYTETFGEDGILDALKNGHSIMTDGPLVIFNITNEYGETKIIGDEISGSQFTLNIQWNSTSEFGTVSQITVYNGTIGAKKENPTPIYSFSPNNLNGVQTYKDLADKIPQLQTSYIRIEATTNKGKRAYTNPIWVKTCKSPTDFDLTGAPTQTVPIIVGPYDNPKQSATIYVDVKEGTNPFVPPVGNDLTKDNFTIKIGGDDATVSNVVRTQLGRYAITITNIPTKTQTEYKNNSGLFDLNITLSYCGNIQKTFNDAIKYQEPTTGDVDAVEIIDRSGSMSGSKIVAARDGAKAFIGQMKDGDMAGVVSFNCYTSVDFGLQELTPSSRSTAESAIDGISASGSTSIGGGLSTGFNELKNKGNTSDNWAMVLLSDGQHNCGESVSSAISKITAHTKSIPVYTIGIGSGADANLLKNDIADPTGGFYRFLDTSQPNWQLTFQEIYLDISGVVTGAITITSTRAPITQGQTNTHNIIVDPSITTLTVTTAWVHTDLNLTLIKPDGTPVNTSDPNVNYTKSAKFATYMVKNPELGNWTAEVYGVSVTGTEDYTFRATAMTNLTMDAYTDKSKYNINEPVKIVSMILNGTTPVINASVNAEVTRPDTTTETITLYDDGNHGDGQSNDGAYAAYYTNTKLTGNYNIKVTAKDPSFTRETTLAFDVQSVGVSVSVTPTTWDVTSLPGESIEKNFTISSSVNLTAVISATDLTDGFGNVISLMNFDFNPSVLTVSAGGSQNFTAKLTIPSNIAAGNYTGSIVISTTEGTLNVRIALNISTTAVYSNTFTGSITKTESKYLDTIPSGANNVTITLESSNDLDLSLYNSSAEMIVGWKGIISQYDGGVFHYNGMEINYSGFYSGSEYIKIDKTTEALDLKVYGFYAGDYLVNLTYTTIPIAPPPVINDTTPPIISKVQSKVLSGTSAIITWDTDELSNSIVKYGTTTSLGSTQINASYVRSHSVTLTGLTSDTQYYFEVQSTDASGNTAIENNNGSYYTFTIPSFKGSLNQNELKYLQTIPSGANNVNITLEASSDIDLNLFDSTGNLIVGWKGIISQYDGGIFHYNGMTINYSGFYGGSEYIKIDRTTEALDLKVFGLSAGDYAVNVEYS